MLWIHANERNVREEKKENIVQGRPEILHQEYVLSICR